MAAPDSTHGLVFIVPAFNAAATLGQTLRSILDQTLPGVSALVIDDGSADDTPQIAHRFASADPRVRVIRQDNRGLAGARNRGVAELLAQLYSGPVCFLDADDLVVPTFAERMLDALAEADAVTCAYRMVGPALEDVGWVIRPSDHDLTPERLIEFNPLAVGAVVVRLSALGRTGLLESRIGGAPFDQALRVHEDWDVWLRFTAAGGSWAPPLGEPLFSYRMLPGSMSGALAIMHRVGLRVIDAAPVSLRVKPQAMRHWHLRSVARAVARGDMGLTRSFLSLVRPPLPDPDLELLAGSLRWAFCREHRVGPGRVTAAQEADWRVQVSVMLQGQYGLETILQQLTFGEAGWLAVARSLLARLAGGRTGVIYGLGRNGRDLLKAIEEILDASLSQSLSAGETRPALPRLAWVDDDANAQAPTLLGRPLPRLRSDALTPQHLIVVTPEQRSGITSHLSALGLPAPETPQSLLRAATAPRT